MTPKKTTKKTKSVNVTPEPVAAAVVIETPTVAPSAVISAGGR